MGKRERNHIEPNPVLADAFPWVNAHQDLAYFSEVGDLVQALVYSWLFWPKVSELHGAVFLELEEGRLEHIAAQLSPGADIGPIDMVEGMSWEEVVNNYNRYEIAYLFANWRDLGDLLEGAVELLAGVLVNTWRARLNDAFPGRCFLVRITDPDPEEGLMVEIRQIDPPLQVPRGWDPVRRHIFPGGL